jgi:hypothetical protein
MAVYGISLVKNAKKDQPEPEIFRNELQHVILGVRDLAVLM